MKLLLRGKMGPQLQNIVSRHASRSPVFRNVETINLGSGVSVGKNVAAYRTLQALH
jgi:hypothetical protein